jgi:serine/threonine protein kinase
LLVKLAATSEELPPSTYVSVTELEFTKDKVLGGGGFATVYKAVCDGKPVAVKVLNATYNPSADIRMVSVVRLLHCLFSWVLRQKLCREALVWQHLQHRFVLPFIGLQRPIAPGHQLPYMVSPLAAKHGTLDSYIKSSDYAPVEDSFRIVTSKMLYKSPHYSNRTSLALAGC